MDDLLPKIYLKVKTSVCEKKNKKMRCERIIFFIHQSVFVENEAFCARLTTTGHCVTVADRFIAHNGS